MSKKENPYIKLFQDAYNNMPDSVLRPQKFVLMLTEKQKKYFDDNGFKFEHKLYPKFK